MQSYVFRYKKRFFFRKIIAIGHKYIPEMDRMDVHHHDGSITSFGRWSLYDLKLGQDWVLYTKRQIELESGQSVTLKLPTEPKAE